LSSGDEDCAEGALDEFLEEGRGGRSSIVTMVGQGREAWKAGGVRGRGGDRALKDVEL